jgi:hypothetical protein
MGGARGPGSSGDLLVEVGTKLVAPLERSPVPGERQLDRQRQEPALIRAKASNAARSLESGLAPANSVLAASKHIA